MALTPQQRQIGMANYQEAVRLSRRQFLSGTLTIPAVAGGMYFGYDKITNGGPVRAGIIGTGDQGNYAHISQSNPDFIQFVAFSDIRPSSVARARKTFNEKYGQDADKIKYYEDYKQLLADKDVELVIVVLPLHLHAQVSIEAMRAGKHVLCEKLMAKTVEQCKEMVRVSDQEKKLLAIGHQRHYSYLYHNCLSIIEGGYLGDIKHIRAFWHRNQTGAGGKDAHLGNYDSWSKLRQILPEDEQVNCEKYGYKSLVELVRWRIFERTGGGLMAELGSHQLDACSIFLGKVHPKAVHGTGVRAFFQDEREIDDHVFLTYEYPEDRVVTYSCISTNAFDQYGEQVMGTKGTLLVESERDALVFSENGGRDSHIKWAEKSLTRPAAASGSTKQWATGVEAAETMTSRGYREEQEHLAWLIRNPDAIVWPSKEDPHPENDPKKAAGVPRCHGRVGLADAVIALCSNLAMAKKKRIEFVDEWFDPTSDRTPEAEV